MGGGSCSTRRTRCSSNRRPCMHLTIIDSEDVLTPARTTPEPRLVVGAGKTDGVARGTLRIYLGAAPGVGKSFAMLDEGHRRAERGTDVVLAVLDDHQRCHTAARADGLARVEP